MGEDIELLRQEVAELKQRVSAAEQWAEGVHLVLQNVLPVLLRGHPEIEPLQELMKSASDRFESGRVSPDEPELGVYEPSKVLYRLFEQLGVWPGVDPHQAAESAIERHRR